MSFKRKRKNLNGDHLTEIEYCSNNPFSLTPKKIIDCNRLIQQTKQDTNPFVTNLLESKSIVDVTESKRAYEGKINKQNGNPFEVIRKPPKKKKRHANISDACFENRALNLNVKAKQFNPFEVHREHFQVASDLRQPHSYINNALNIRSQDSHSIYNPFEVKRSATNENESNGIENLGLDVQNSDFLRIKLPFRPTVSCRIDFKNTPIPELPPSKLLEEKLVFSPINSVIKQSGSLVNEEAALDIGKELDRYQLELENSINEAKLRKHINTVQASIQHSLILPDKNNISIQALENITKKKDNHKEGTNTDCQKKNISKQNIITLIKNKETRAKLEIESPQNCAFAEDVAYASESDEDVINFQLPTFVRAYRRIPSQKPIIAELPSDPNQPIKPEHNTQTNVKSFLRNSVLKYIHRKSKIGLEIKQSEKNKNIITCIRQSLRHKRPLMEKQLIGQDISIVDTGDRIMKLKSVVPETEYIAIEQLTNERKSSLRTSLRHPTRDKLKKSLFQKSQEQYVLSKKNYCTS